MPLQQLNHPSADAASRSEYSNFELFHRSSSPSAILLPSLSIFTANGVARTPCFSKTLAIARPALFALAGFANAHQVGPAPLNATPSRPRVLSARISFKQGMRGHRLVRW